MTGEALRVVIAAAAALAGWLIPRRVAAARIAVLPSVLLDVFPVLLAGGLLLLATGRPLFAGLVLLALGSGFALADQAKREAVREPVVFSDMSELRHVFTHPHLYLPFAGPTLVVGGALTTIGFGIGLLFFSPPLWQPEPLFAAPSLLALWTLGWILSREPMLGRAAAVLRRLRPTGEPFADAARLGPFATLLVYGIIARAERTQRRAHYSPLPTSPPAPALKTGGAAIPVVVVQCESFFDARRISTRIPGDLLRGFDACVQQGATHGRFDVSAWGANTMRAEFAVLTGIPDDRLGYDRFNPYHAFARAPLASLASHLRGEGYRTVCLHPFDRSFFRRDLTLAALGFETFLGRDTLGGSRRPPYRSDPDLARQIINVLDEEGPRTFIFVITMGNHGPWQEVGPEIDPALRTLFDPADLPQGGALLRYLDGLARSDQMLGILLDELGPRRRNALFGFYGDHLPSLPHAFGHLAFDDWASDYVLVDGAAPRARRLDLPAHLLPWVILDRLRERGAIERPREAALGAA
jgi:Sulfatase